MITRVSFLLALIGLCTLPSESFAQKKYALLIGVNQYDHDKLRPLKFAVNDAVELGEVLEKHGYEVTYLTDTKGKAPTKENIDAGLAAVLKVFKKGDTILLGMAGHGMQFGKEAYFCPQDAKPFEDEVATMIPLGGVWGKLDRAFSGTKLVMVDACRDDGTRGIRGGADGIPLPPEGVGVLLSCAKGQVAYEDATLKHGVFFHHVIEGLKGAAKDSKNHVTWDRLREYVKSEVPQKVVDLYGVASGAKQNPNEMGNLIEVPILVKLSVETTPKIEPKVENGEPKPGEERTAEIFKGVKMKFCWIPAGEAQLGSPKEEQDYITKTFFDGKRPDFMDSETESVRGKFKTQGFWLGKYEVTQSQWEAVMGKNPSKFKGANLPVENASWDDCQEFIKKCKIAGVKVRLPHEDQWEYACRGGKGNKQPFYWGDTLNGDKANCKGIVPYGTDKKGAYKEKTTEVGVYEKEAPHPWNLCDMHGNVWEWCDNLYMKDGGSRVRRGGGWEDFTGDCVAAGRGEEAPTEGRGDLGFRLALVP